MSRPATLGELRRAGYRYRPVKTELRENLIRKLRAGEPLFPGLVGYDNTVIPQLVNGILARHDLLLLGLRGQAKTRILRALPELLDEFVPVAADADVFDDPLEPQLRSTRKLIDIHGDDTAVRWAQRAERYHEKLATPDVTIADLIGDIDLVKHAEGRYLTDESTMHFGLVPRSNRGIFALNELPDLPPRIQVGLFNVLEERDVQIRGYPIRLNLDVLLVFSANPEDYTNRGRIVTPLKDRIGTVVRTHYPLNPADAMRISRANAWLARPQGQPQVELPRFVHEIIEETVRLARQSPHVSQQSGVSVRASITALEVVVANAERRAILRGEAAIVPRVSDLASVQAAARGKIELLLAEDEAAEDRLLRALMGEALKSVAGNYLELDELEEVVARFLGGKTSVEVGDEVPAAEVLENARPINGLLKAAEAVCRQAECDARSPLHLASAVEFVLEALHVNNKLSKYAYNTRTFYRK